MKQLLRLITCYCFLAVVIQGQGYPDFSAGIAELRAVLGIAANVSLVQMVISSGVTPADQTYETVTSSNIVIRFELRVNSLPVYDAGVTAEFFPNGTYAGLWISRGANIIVNDDGSPRVSSRRALYILARKFNLCSVMKYFQNKDFSLYYLMNPSTNLGRLIYRASFLYLGHEGDYETTAIVQPTALIDANTGEVLQSWNGFTEQFKGTTRIAAIGGNNGEEYPRRNYEALLVGLLNNDSCVYNASDVQVQNMNSQRIKQFEPTVFVCSAAKSDKYDFANGGYSPLNDAMNNAQKTVEMYRRWVSGINQPHFEMPLKLRVHFDSQYSGASWDGIYAYFGDGNRSTVYPVVTPEVVAHELGHAYTSYRNGSKLEVKEESGGINEAFSDMSGQAALVYSGRHANWKPGMEYNKEGTPLRHMDNPKADGASIDNFKYYRPMIDPHYTSGLFNKAFYQLVVVSNSSYWTMANTFQVFAYANRMVWLQQSKFSEAVCGVQKAANHVLGARSVADVEDAFKKVGLTC